MKPRMKYYCKSCRHFLNRLNVQKDDYEDKYYCKFCDNPVLRTEKIAEDILQDFIDYAIEKGDTEKYE